MKRRWTIEKAMKHIAMVDSGKLQKGLTYCSALSFLRGRVVKGK